MDIEEELKQPVGNPNPFSVLSSLIGSKKSNSAINSKSKEKEINPEEIKFNEMISTEIPSTKSNIMLEGEFNVEVELARLKNTPTYPQLRTRILALPPHQQKAALKYAISLHENISSRTKVKLNHAASNQQVTGSTGTEESKKEANEVVVSLAEVEDRELLYAVRHGEVEKLRQLLKRFERPVTTMVAARASNFTEGISEDEEEDKHPLLHWAALDDQVEVIEFLLSGDHKNDGISVLARNSRGETALHWAVHNGHIRCLHTLLVNLDLENNNRSNMNAPSSKNMGRIVDHKGYSLLHVAAQFGHSEIIARLIKSSRIEIDVRDNCGRTALHWAVYKGHQLSAKYLLSKGSDIEAKDWEECTSLHWAALQGNKQMLVLLLKHVMKTNGKLHLVKYLTQVDKTGKTAEQLAADKGRKFHDLSDQAKKYKMVSEFLAKIKKSQFIETRSLEEKKHFTWYLWPIFGPINLYIYYHFLFAEFYYQYPMINLISVSSYFMIWVMWVLLQRGDPGYVTSETDGANKSYKIKSKEKDKDELLREYYKQLYLEVIENGLLVPVCVTCEIVKPLRSKHDAITDKCVYKFDHFCPWVGRPIAQNNYKYFVFFLFFGVLCIAGFLFFHVIITFYHPLVYGSLKSTSVVVYYIFQAYMWSFLAVLIYGIVMLGQHSFLIARNMTTNEIINRHRYKYLNGTGENPNQFSRGIIKNWLEFFGFIDPVKVNIKKYYKFQFERGSEMTERLQRMKELQEIREGRHGAGANDSEELDLESGIPETESLLSITTSKRLTAQDINMSMLPLPLK